MYTLIIYTDNNCQHGVKHCGLSNSTDESFHNGFEAETLYIVKSLKTYIDCGIKLIFIVLFIPPKPH